MLLVMSACSITENDVKTIKVDKTDYCEWNSLMEIDQVVPLLDTLSAPKLSVARKCVVADQRIFFWDYKSRMIYAYDLDGNYLFTVGGLGRSDREYIDISDIALTPDQKEIHVLDKSGIKEYDANTGNFLRKKTFKSIDCSAILSFQPCGEYEFLLFTPEMDYSISKIDGSDLTTSLRKRNGYQMIYSRFALANGLYMVIPDYGQYTIDCIQDNKIIPSYRIDLGGKSLPEEKIPNDYESFIKVDNSKEYFKVTLGYFENNKYVYASMIGPNQTYYDLFYSKAEERAYVGPHDLNTNIVFTGMDNEYLYGLVYPEYVKADSPYYDLFRSYIVRGLQSYIS